MKIEYTNLNTIQIQNKIEPKKIVTILVNPVTMQMSSKNRI